LTHAELTVQCTQRRAGRKAPGAQRVPCSSKIASMLLYGHSRQDAPPAQRSNGHREEPNGDTKIGPGSGPDFGAGWRAQNPHGKGCEPAVLVRLLPWLFWGRLAAPKRGPPGGPFFGQGAIDASETPPAHTATNPLKLTTPSLGEHNGTAGAVRLFTRCVHDSRTWSMKHPRNLL